MNLKLLACIVLGSFLGGLGSVSQAQKKYPNVVTAPVNNRPYPKAILPGYTADPHVSVFNDKFYIFPTDDKGVWNEITQFIGWSSDDLVNWKKEGVIFDYKNVSWAKSRAWAPAMVEKNGKYYFYFTAAPQIGVAVADSPIGPFADAIGKPLIATGPRNKGVKGGFGSIDPMVFTDDDGQSYLYAGIGRCRVYKLKEDMISVDPDFKDITPKDYLEGPFVFKRNGKYYFTWSQYGTGSKYYSVWYGIGDSPTGPFERQEQPITWPQGDVFGPGHHSIVQVPGKDEWYIVYHRLTKNKERAEKTETNRHIGRETCIAPMYFNEDGTIKIVDLYEEMKPLKTK